MGPSSATKKYKLFSASADTAGPKLCAFFMKPEGCRSGSNCKFSHGDASTPSTPVAPRQPVEISDNLSMVSSESEGRAAPTPKARKPVQQLSNDDDDPFGSPSQANRGKTQFATGKQKTPASKNKRKAKQDTPKAAATPTFEKVTPAKKKVKKEYVSPPPAAAAAPQADFRSFISNLPVASFSIPGVTAPTVPVIAPPAATKMESVIPLPTSTEVGRKWQATVLKTREHERYAGSFDFEKCKQADQESGVAPLGSWIKAKPYGPWAANNPQVIAIDCEMCETEDPVTGNKNSKALCRLSVVNGEKPEEVLIDTLVKPEWPIVDYRSRINGIKKEHLDSVQFTMDHAKAFMMALCSEETVIVGHAVNNDLIALKMEHHCNADSAFLYESKDTTGINSACSLKDLVKTILQKEMPATHDSVNDARKAFECVDFYRVNDGKVPKIERTPRNNGHKLFVHRIPKQLNPEHLVSMFMDRTFVMPKEAENIEFNGETGKTHVVFKSARHATLAFDSLEGSAEADASKKLQKKVYLKNGSYVRVRLMNIVKKRDSIGGTSSPPIAQSPK